MGDTFVAPEPAHDPLQFKDKPQLKHFIFGKRI